VHVLTPSLRVVLLRCGRRGGWSCRRPRVVDCERGVRMTTAVVLECALARILTREPLVELTAVEKVYRMGKLDFHALRGIDLSIGAGELVAIVGPSGSGKTTILNLVTAIGRPTAGTVTVDRVREPGEGRTRRSRREAAAAAVARRPALRLRALSRTLPRRPGPARLHRRRRLRARDLHGGDAPGRRAALQLTRAPRGDAMRDRHRRAGGGLLLLLVGGGAIYGALRRR
jgi:hypothetical protein